MHDQNKISRRKLLKKLAYSLSIPTSLLWYFGAKKSVATSGEKRVVIPNNLPDGITFLDRAVIKKDGNNITAFSSKCTHLGCKINSTINGKLVCPCHGSKFNYNGIPENGPATKPLEILNIKTETSSGDMVLYV